MTELHIDAREIGIHTYVVGDQVRIGGGKHTWHILSFFGPNYSYAELQRTDLPSTHTSAHLARLRPVTP